MIMHTHPRAKLASRLKDGQFNDWTREGARNGRGIAYPKTLKRAQMPTPAYRKQALRISGEAIALGGYRLADRQCSENYCRAQKVTT